MNKYKKPSKPYGPSSYQKYLKEAVNKDSTYKEYIKLIKS